MVVDHAPGEVLQDDQERNTKKGLIIKGFELWKVSPLFLFHPLSAQRSKMPVDEPKGGS